MILFWGLPGDTPLSAVAAVLTRHRIEHIFLDQQDSMEWSLELEVGDSISGYLRNRQRTFDLVTIHAAYLRPYDARQIPTFASWAPGLAHIQALSEGLLAWAEISPARIVNRPSAMAPNNSKPYQSLQIRALGFSTPDTLITTDPDAALEFWEKHRDVIYKSVSSVRSIVSRLSSEHRERIRNVRWCPTQFQRYVPGMDYRVHVVGDSVFAHEIVSEADDYRYASRNGRSAKIRRARLPNEIAARCRRLSAAVDLPIAGIDLRRTPEDEWFCFEVNPSPGFTYYQEATGQPIAEAIARFLRTGK